MGKNIFGIVLILIISKTSFSQDQPAQKGKRPNILICMADDASFPYMGAYGTTWVKTPAFDSVAKAGILFMNAYTPNAKCAPSRASILTGRNSWQLEAAGNHWSFFPEKYRTFIEVLTDNGYHTGYTLKGWAPGKLAGDSKRMLTGKPYNEKTIVPPTTGIATMDYAGNFASFMNDRPDNTPFCFWYGSVEPHRAYEYGSGVRKGNYSIDQIDRVPEYWPDTDSVRTDMLDFALELAYFDSHILKMLQLLREKNELDNTIVIVTADNGMPFPRAKGQSYEISNHLPLAIMWESGIREPGRREAAFVSFIDFAPTLLECAGIAQKDTQMESIEGKSFVDLFQNKESNVNRETVFIGKERHDIGRPDDVGYPMRGIRKGKYLYVKNYEPTRWPAGNPETGYLNVDGGATKSYILNLRRRQVQSSYWHWSFGKRPAEELYDITNDPDCLTNLADMTEFKAIRDRIRIEMEKELLRQGDPRMVGKGYLFDQYPYADDSGRDFYNRFMRGEKMNAGWVSTSDFEKEDVE
ncbi:MAG: sulfatase [Cyclobacteriaceae bacterium]|nr:sulfatase [Cyclobacteriaceae bacterium]MDH4295672.1 sulfatase [Cyclobacteriaceae bacterium]MDH5249984.1 sulfatase [Cyclobacteriaceae bacterium]